MFICFYCTEFLFTVIAVIMKDFLFGGLFMIICVAFNVMYNIHQQLDVCYSKITVFVHVWGCLGRIGLGRYRYRT